MKIKQLDFNCVTVLKYDWYSNTSPVVCSPITTLQPFCSASLTCDTISGTFMLILKKEYEKIALQISNFFTKKLTITLTLIFFKEYEQLKDKTEATIVSGFLKK